MLESLLCGDRRAGLEHFLGAPVPRRCSRAPELWATLALGLLGPRPLAGAKAAGRQRRSRGRRARRERRGPLSAVLSTGSAEGDVGVSGPAGGAPGRIQAVGPQHALQLVSQVAGVVFTAGLTLYLVRALGASGYGAYALAVTIGALVAVPRRASDCRGRSAASWPTTSTDLDQLRAIFLPGGPTPGRRALLAAAALFAPRRPGGPARSGDPHLGWPLRWVAAVGRRAGDVRVPHLGRSPRSAASRLGLWMALIESATRDRQRARGSGGCRAGAAGGDVGQGASAIAWLRLAGLYLTLACCGRAPATGAAQKARGAPHDPRATPARCSSSNVPWSAIAQIDVAADRRDAHSRRGGSFSAVLRPPDRPWLPRYRGRQRRRPAALAGVASPDTRAFIRGDPVPDHRCRAGHRSDGGVGAADRRAPARVRLPQLAGDHAGPRPC